MPWRNLPPDTLQLLMQLGGLAIAGLIGSASRISEQIARGDRARIWGPELWVDVTSFCVMLLLSYGISDYYTLPLPAAVALTGILCRAGTPLLDIAIKALVAWVQKQGK